MEKFIISQIKEMEGNLLGIGINNEKIKKAINKNNKINICNLLKKKKKGFGKHKLASNKHGRKVNIKKIKKVFRKKRVDNVICNLETVKPYLKTFVRDSVYINKGKLYIYGSFEDLNELTIKYQRYTKDIKIEKEGKVSILIVNNQNTKNNKLKDIGYWWADTFTAFVDFLTLILVN